MQEASTLKYLL